MSRTTRSLSTSPIPTTRFILGTENMSQGSSEYTHQHHDMATTASKLTISETDGRSAEERVNAVLSRATQLTDLAFGGPSLSTYFEQKLCGVELPELRSLCIDRADAAAAMLRHGCRKLQDLLLYRVLGGFAMRWNKWQTLFSALTALNVARTLRTLCVSFIVPNNYHATTALQDIARSMPCLAELRVGLYLESHPGSRLPWHVVKVSAILFFHDTRSRLT